MPIRLAVVDGHTLTRGGLRELVGQQPGIEVAAGYGPSGLAADSPARRLVAA